MCANSCASLWSVVVHIQCGFWPTRKWILQRSWWITGELFSRLVWSRIGAERDADLIVDSAGSPVVEGGSSATARDMARFGKMHLQGGVAGGRQVVHAECTDPATTRNQELIDMFADGCDADPANTEANHHDCWWVWNAALGRYAGYGLGGQNLLIDRTGNTVIVKLSSCPKRMDPLLTSFVDSVNNALFDHLGNG